MQSTGIPTLVKRVLNMKVLKVAVLIICILSTNVFVSGCQGQHEVTDNQSTHTASSRNTQDFLLLYSDAISDYEKIVEFRLSQKFEDDYNSGRKPSLSKDWTNYVLARDGVKTEGNEAQYHWNCMLIDMLDYISQPTKGSFGYILRDLSGDGVPELVWVNMDYRVYCIFTIADNQVRLVDSFWPRYACTIQNNGELLILGSSGVCDYVYSLKRIDSSTDMLVTLTKFGKEDGMCYIEEGYRSVLTDREFEELCAAYSFAVSDKWKNNTIHSLEDSFS